MNIILIGVQGSGKGTQANKLEHKSGWKHINVGNLFRKHISNETPTGKAAQEYITKGLLVPDQFVLGMVKKELDKYTNGFVLDGFPRNVNQEKYLLENYHIDSVLFLDLSDDIAKRRIMARMHCENCKQDYNLLYNPPKRLGICDNCGGNLIRREDDTEKAIDKRIEKFHNETKPVIELFEKRELLHIINADQEVEKIHQDILDILHIQ